MQPWQQARSGHEFNHTQSLRALTSAVPKRDRTLNGMARRIYNGCDGAHYAADRGHGPTKVRGMKSVLVICCSLIALVAASVAAAGPFEHEMRFRPFVQAQPPRPEPQRDAARPEPPRDMRGPPSEADRGRMSQDERRQLRRDIQDAGNDIYRRDRQPPGRQQRR